jgi:hypothetical protein
LGLELLGEQGVAERDRILVTEAAVFEKTRARLGSAAKAATEARSRARRERMVRLG